MWHQFIALAFVAPTIALITVVGLAALGWLKRKAVSTTIASVSKSLHDHFWGYVRRQVQAETKQGARPYERTYRGVFHGCFHYTNPPHEHYFEIKDARTIVKVPIAQTNLLSGVNPGETVVIETLAGAHYFAEIIQRVRVVEKQSEMAKSLRSFDPLP